MYTQMSNIICTIRCIELSEMYLLINLSLPRLELDLCEEISLVKMKKLTTKMETRLRIDRIGLHRRYTR